MSKSITKSYYGDVVLLKGYCKECKTKSFIIDGEFQCCDSKVSELHDKEIKKREIEGESKRSRIKKKVRLEILEKQNNKCIYCENDFDTPFWHDKKKRYIKIRVHFDHFISWNYSRDNQKNNLYAACHICNGIKSDKFFYNLISAKEYINERRRVKGIV